MVTEIADFSVQPGREDEFAAAYAKGMPLLDGVPGCRSAKLIRGVESPSRFLAVLEWDSLEAHSAYMASATFREFGALIDHLFAATPVMEHFTAS